MIKILLPASIIAFIAGISLSLFLMGDSNKPDNSQLNLPEGGNFTLHNGNKAVSLNDFKGKAVFLFFGYTSCPDVCPTSLALISSALKTLDDEQKKKVQVIFISVDPERDTPEKLQNYTKYFHANIVGVTGSKAEIDKVVKQYGAAYRKVESDSAMGYLVDHSASVFVVNTKGKLVDILPHGLPVESIAQVMRDLI